MFPWLKKLLDELSEYPAVDVPTDVPMANYKWKPTFHGSLIPKKEDLPSPEPLPEPKGALFDLEFHYLKDKAWEALCTPVTATLEKIVQKHSLKEPAKKAEPVAQTATSKAKAKKKVATPKKKAAPAIFQWTMQSSQDVGGQKAVYSTLLRSNGDLTCNCPGWIFKRGVDRSCRHTRLVEDEGKKLYKDFKAGKELPAMELVGAGAIATTANPKKDGDLKYGRRIMLD